MTMQQSRAICELGRDIANTWEIASRREWLVTNGIGGYAAGTVSGANTRRYHGLLIASLKPPVDRVLLLAKAEICVAYLGREYELSANEFDGGTIAPKGFVHIQRFWVENGIPTWRFEFADALLEQRIFMSPGSNATHVSLRVVRASAPLQLFITPLCTNRDYHAHRRGAWPFEVTRGVGCCTVQGTGSKEQLQISISQGEFAPGADWYWNFFHRMESERGLDTSEELFKPGRFVTTLAGGEEIFLTASAPLSTTPAVTSPITAIEALARLTARSDERRAALPATAPDWIRELTEAADQFVVTRGHAKEHGSSVIAGYPWFADWGRDTMISLPGITSTLGRHEIATNVLRTFAKYVDRGMLPNRFPDSGETPEYNTVDATLWFFQAIQAAITASGDDSLGRELYATLIVIIRAHLNGTRYGIQVDLNDALLKAGEPGIQLTWMDAKVGDWVVTPRTGKAVEVNALWLNALDITLRLAKAMGDSAGQQLCGNLLERGSASFAKFWNKSTGFLYDVLDVNGGAEADPRLRPNQLFAVSLPYSALTLAQMKAIVTACGRELLTSYGLRSLGRTEPGYIGRYTGDPRNRDAAYHQGTVWSWLIGPFALAHFRVYGDAAQAQAFLEPIGLHLRDACQGSVSEIFDGDPPHAPKGCFAQAWGVAEVLRSWLYLENIRLRTRGSQ
jgi:predicted glycogen debranching enzyme